MYLDAFLPALADELEKIADFFGPLANLAMRTESNVARAARAGSHAVPAVTHAAPAVAHAGAQAANEALRKKQVLEAAARRLSAKGAETGVMTAAQTGVGRRLAAQRQDIPGLAQMFERQAAG